MTSDILLFFGGKPEELALYEALENALISALPPFEVRTARTQLSFFGKTMFGCVSLMRPRRKSEMPSRFITLSFGLAYRKESPRIAAAVEVARNRWTHHAVIGSAEEIDDELIGWLMEAYLFSCRK